MIYTDKFIKKTKIMLNEFFDGEETYIVLREPDLEEAYDFREITEDDMKPFFKVFKSHFKDFIVEHNFEKSENELMSNSEVSKIILSKIDLAQKVITEYMSASFFTQSPSE